MSDWHPDAIEFANAFNNLKSGYVKKKLMEIEPKVSPNKPKNEDEKHMKVRLHILLNTNISRYNQATRGKWLLKNSIKILNDYSELTKNQQVLIFLIKFYIF